MTKIQHRVLARLLFLAVTLLPVLIGGVFAISLFLKQAQAAQTSNQATVQNMQDMQEIINQLNSRVTTLENPLNTEDSLNTAVFPIGLMKFICAVNRRPLPELLEPLKPTSPIRTTSPGPQAALLRQLNEATAKITPEAAFHRICGYPGVVGAACGPSEGKCQCDIRAPIDDLAGCGDFLDECKRNDWGEGGCINYICECGPKSKFPPPPPPSPQ